MSSPPLPAAESEAWHRLVPRPGVAVRVPCLRKSKQLVWLDRVTQGWVGQMAREAGRPCSFRGPGTMGERCLGRRDSVLPPLCKKGWQQVCSWRPGRGPAVTQRGHWSWHYVGRAGVCFGVGLTGLDQGRDGVGGTAERGGQVECEILQELDG